MADFTEGIQNALTHIEENLTEELEIRDIAKQAFLSPFYFQRIFGAMCGISVGEYIRGRRLNTGGGRNWQVPIPRSSILRQSTATTHRTVLIGPFSASTAFPLPGRRKQA